MKRFELPLRVYFEDTDAGGVVFYGNYLRFLERARTEMVREMGYSQERLRHEADLLFVVRHLEADYFKPARLDDALIVRTQLIEAKRTSFILAQHVDRGDARLFSSKVTMVAVNTAIRPVRLPNWLLEALD